MRVALHILRVDITTAAMKMPLRMCSGYPPERKIAARPGPVIVPTIPAATMYKAEKSPMSAIAFEFETGVELNRIKFSFSSWKRMVHYENEPKLSIVVETEFMKWPDSIPSFWLKAMSARKKYAFG
jgi:hypothetical protein